MNGHGQSHFLRGEEHIGPREDQILRCGSALIPAARAGIELVVRFRPGLLQPERNIVKQPLPDKLPVCIQADALHHIFGQFRGVILTPYLFIQMPDQ